VKALGSNEREGRKGWEQAIGFLSFAEGKDSEAHRNHGSGL